MVVADKINHTVAIMHIGDYMRYKVPVIEEYMLAKHDIDENEYYEVLVLEKDTSNVYVAKVL